ncbi:MAG: N-acetylmuramoyl-L-alanine amidase [Caldithrix sp.]|nr:MAG: N-acetylmuramoyl-L-alanine amidase [Caldithrix sp.]
MTHQNKLVSPRILKAATVLAFLFCTLFSNTSFAQLSLDVVYPKEGDVVMATDSTFVFGSVDPPGARAIVNGVPVRTYPNGAFLGYVPVGRGDFAFDCMAVLGRDTVAVRRSVFIPPYLTSTPQDTFAIDTTFLFPQDNLELVAGDELQVAFKGTPGLIGTFSIPGLVENVVMTEAPLPEKAYWGEAVFGEGKQVYPPAVAGIYHGVYKIPAGNVTDSIHVHFKLAGVNGIDVAAVAPGKLTILDDAIPRIAELTDEMTVARTGPGLAYHLFLPRGVKLRVSGKQGPYYRASLGRSEDVWVPESSLDFLPPGTPPPRSEIAVVRTEDRGDRVALRIYLQEKLPIQVDQIDAPSAIVLTIYGGISHTDWIRYDVKDDFVRGIEWSQPARTTYRLTVSLAARQHWGYHAFYEGNVLVLEIRKPPRKFSLKGKVICLDPGHGPDKGAIGPGRLMERDANLALAQVLKKKLERKGAIVYLTRGARHGVALSARTKMAAYIDADIFLSLHHNALPDGVNPFRSRGSSTYYYHPQSRPLAAAIQEQMLKKLKLSDFGLYYDNLSVCRITQMPSVLIEPAFIMHPEEEMLINSKRFRNQTADAIVKGVEAFFKQAKES